MEPCWLWGSPGLGGRPDPVEGGWRRALLVLGWTQPPQGAHGEGATPSLLPRLPVCESWPVFLP